MRGNLCNRGFVFFPKCSRIATRTVSRLYEDGATVTSHECAKHADQRLSKKVVAMSNRALTKSAA